jgi:uncharacterized protein (TIGR01777 family)
MANSLTFAITGSNGFIGSNLKRFLEHAGHNVIRLVRQPPANKAEVFWDANNPNCSLSALNKIDALIHLAGENIAAGRWNAARKRAIMDSRVAGTNNLSLALAKLPVPPKKLICASATGFYGDRGDEILDEESGQGAGFLPDVAAAWEKSTAPAAAAGIKVVHLRFGLVLDPGGGALKNMLLPFRFGIGGPLGAGTQWMSWITLNDLTNIIYFSLLNPEVTEPINAVSPSPVTNERFSKVLAKALHRPCLFRVPAAVLRLLLGEMADALLLSSTRVVPKKLLELGYAFLDADLEAALAKMLAADI